MTKRFLSPVRRSGSLRHKTVQQLQMLALVFVIVLLGLKIYVQMFPSSLLDDITPCRKCMLHGNLSENIDNGSIIVDDTFDTFDDDTGIIKDTGTKDTSSIIKPAVHPIPQSNKKYDFTLITGASENHFCPMKSFLYNMKDTLKGLNARVIVYDLGFTESQRATFKKLQQLGYLTELRTFQWSYYPSFWDINISRGEYAWKPAMVAEVARDYPGKLVWLDSGTLVERRYFVKLNSILRKHKGFVSPRSPGTMQTWTHPGVYDYYNDDHTKYDEFVNCNGASVTFDTKKTQHIIDEWYKCALVKDCIAPPGSSRVNHRQDQAILTYLVAKNNLRCDVNRIKFGIHTHEDGNCKQYNLEYESTNNLSTNDLGYESTNNSEYESMSDT